MKTQQYTYRLATPAQQRQCGGKLFCPACGHFSYVPYVDRDGVVLHDDVGKCDRLNNCGHHYTPREYFADRGIKREPGTGAVKRYRLTPEPQPVYVPVDMVRRSMPADALRVNNLLAFLATLAPAAHVEHVARAYYVGTSAHFGGGAAVFYQIDSGGSVHRGKVMQYDRASGKRVKSPYSMVTSVHSLARLGDTLPPMCLFGAHLLARFPGVPVNLVESEKTALIASLLDPNPGLWLATGGCGNLNDNMMGVLRGRDVNLWPDGGMLDKWRDMGLNSGVWFKSLSISTLMEEQAAERDDDIGDYFVSTALDGRRVAAETLTGSLQRLR